MSVDDEAVDDEPVGDAGPQSHPPSPVVTPPLLPDDDATMVDVVPPVVTFVADGEPADILAFGWGTHSAVHAADRPYRGARRMRHGVPAGAVFVAALILLITAAVAMQLLLHDGRRADRGDGWDALPTQPTLSYRTSAPPPTSPSGSPNSVGPNPAASGSPRANPTRSRSAAAPAGPAGPGLVTPTPPRPSDAVAATGALASTGSIVGIDGKCVTAVDEGQVQLATCAAVGGQRWTLAGDGTVRAAGGCLDVSGGGTANRTPVQLYECNGTPAQRWQRRPDRTWINPQSGRCLDAEGGFSDDGTRLIIWDCHTGANQRWTFG